MRGASIPDPFLLPDSFGLYGSARAPLSGQTIRSPIIDPTKKTLILIGAGQSNATSVSPTLYTPTNSSVVDNFNIFDGAIYNVAGPLLGCSWNPNAATNGSGLGPGNVLVRIADTLVTNGKFDRVIICSIATGSTMMADWGTAAGAGLPMFTRGPVLMARLASKGITPSTPGATFAEIMMIGGKRRRCGNIAGIVCGVVQWPSLQHGRERFRRPKLHSAGDVGCQRHLDHNSGGATGGVRQRRDLYRRRSRHARFERSRGRQRWRSSERRRLRGCGDHPLQRHARQWRTVVRFALALAFWL